MNLKTLHHFKKNNGSSNLILTVLKKENFFLLKNLMWTEVIHWLIFQKFFQGRNIFFQFEQAGQVKIVEKAWQTLGLIILGLLHILSNPFYVLL